MSTEKVRQARLMRMCVAYSLTSPPDLKFLTSSCSSRAPSAALAIIADDSATVERPTRSIKRAYFSSL